MDKRSGNSKVVLITNALQQLFIRAHSIGTGTHVKRNLQRGLIHRYDWGSYNYGVIVPLPGVLIILTLSRYTQEGATTQVEVSMMLPISSRRGGKKPTPKQHTGAR